MRTHSETVSFRADTDLLKLIDAECKRFGISRGSWVRGAIQAHFVRQETPIEQIDLSLLTEKLDSLEQHFDGVRHDTAKSLFYVLTRVGQIPADQAKELVRSKFQERKD